jgi:hypothetical protein
MNARTSRPPEEEPLRRELAEFRVALLALHKTLVDSERVTYEATVGQITSPTHFLQLLTQDAWFAWLKPFSHFIVTLDEVLEQKTALTRVSVEAVFAQARQLLVARENAEGFPGHYDVALQRDPDVVMAHAAVARLLPKAKSDTP